MRTRFLKSSGLLFLPLLLLLMVTIVDTFAQQDVVQNKDALLPEKSIDTIKEDHFTYSPQGRRDPFKPLIQEKQKIIKKVSGRPDKIKGPLEKFELSQYRLVALMIVNGTPRAMVKAPDGRSYTVKVGEYIGMNDGIVKNIETKIVTTDENGLRIEKSPDRIVVEEIGIDSYTGSKTKENRYITM